MATTDSPENPLDRWPFAQFTLDANGDGQFTFTDIFERLWALLFLPGDLFVYVLLAYAAPLARWLELGPGDYLLWDATIPHDSECIGEEPVTILIISHRSHGAEAARPEG